jgi:hypothetical protein
MRCRSALTLAVFAAGCSNNLEKPSQIRGLRVLAMRTTPPTLLLDDGALPSQVTFEALVVDPQGGPVHYTWSFCPLESSRSCDDYAELRDASPDLSKPAGLGVCGLAGAGDGRTIGQALDAARSTTLAGDATAGTDEPGEPPAPALRPYAVAPLTVPIGTLMSLGRYYCLDGFYGFGAGAWPSAVLELSDETGDSMRADKRVVINAAHLAVGNAALQQLGYQFCAQPSDAATSSCIPWDPSLAGNHNPDFVEPLQLARGKSSLGEYKNLCEPNQDPAADSCEPRTIAPGAAVRLRPIFPDTMREPYQVIKTDLQTRSIHLEEAVEELSIAWFVTAGKVQDELTWPKFTKTLDTVYTAPAAPPPDTDGWVTLWLIVRDERGGVGWRHVDLHVEE